MRGKVDILLATYNGAVWLDELIDSLLNQDFSDWRLLVRDDGSTDETLAILKARQVALGEKISLLVDEDTNLGSMNNFARLLGASTADYIMLCDQDDVWLPKKISLTLAKMREVERVHGADTPLMIHTDFRIVDENLVSVAYSGHRFQQIDPIKGNSFGRILVQNIVTGCTTMINRALCDRALPIPVTALMHDHWLSLVASCFGRIDYLPVPTLLYRQHAANQVGAKRWNLAYAAQLLFQLPTIRLMMERNRIQAQAFYDGYFLLLSKRDKALLISFVQMPERGRLQKRRDIFRYDFLYTGVLRNIGWLFLC